MDDDSIQQKLEQFTHKLGPSRGYILINRQFYLHWKDEILNCEVQFVDPAGNVHSVWVRNDKNVGLFLDGVNEVVKFYGLDKLHVIHFSYISQRRFYIKVMATESVEIDYPSSDPPTSLQVVGWDKSATPSFVVGDQALYVPADVVRSMLKSGQREVELISETGLRAKGTIMANTKRTKSERYIGGGWYEFCKELNIAVFSVVKFRFHGNSNELFVSID